MNFIIRLVLNGAALYLVAYLVPGVSVSGPLGALVAAVVLGIVNAILRPILIILSLPVEILTLGLFTFVINAALFWFVGHLGLGLTVTGFWPALLGSLILSIISFMISRALVPARD
jgi:putative membrane protein